MSDRREWYSSCSDDQLRRLYQLWVKGQMTKVAIERKFFHDAKSQAKGITGAWRDRLGIETEGRSAQSLRIEQLERILQEELELAAKKFEEITWTGRGGITPSPGLLARRFRARAQELAA